MALASWVRGTNGATPRLRVGNKDTNAITTIKQNAQHTNTRLQSPWGRALQLVVASTVTADWAGCQSVKLCSTQRV